MAVFVEGLVVLIVFYIVILLLGIWAGRKTSHRAKEGVFLANREFGMVVATFTLTATMVGGGYINGTAEAVYKFGLAWTIAPVAYSVGMILGGVFFAPKLRRAMYTTVFDPFQAKYGNRLGALMFIPQLMGDLFWGAAILRALGSSLAIILDLDQTISVIVSACIAIGYTFFGGLYSVAYTDVVQMIFIAVGLYGAFPFALQHDAVDLSRITENNTWQGDVTWSQTGMFVDDYLMLTIGGIPWQVFFQRSLACRTPFIAGAATVLGGIFSFLQGIPAIAIGIIAKAADWNQTDFGHAVLSEEHQAMVLPLVLHYLCPTAVSVIGLGAVSAAVMSSADSMVLSVGSCFSHNVYKNIFRPQASDRELIWVLRVSIVIAGVVATAIALLVTSVYVLFYLCSDILYVINFPQLVLCLWFDFVDSYGYLTGVLVGFFLRIGGGEKYLKFPALIAYPAYDYELNIQRFPYKFLSMASGFVTSICVSLVTRFIFKGGYLSLKYDFLGFYKMRAEEAKGIEDKGEEEEMAEMRGKEDVEIRGKGGDEIRGKGEGEQREKDEKVWRERDDKAIRVKDGSELRQRGDSE